MSDKYDKILKNSNATAMQYVIKQAFEFGMKDFLMHIQSELNSDFMNYAFIIACKRNKLEFVQWVFSLGKITEYELAFSDAFNNLEVLQWIYSIAPISKVYIKQVLQRACYIGNLDVAKWCYSVYPMRDFSIYNISDTNIQIWIASLTDDPTYVFQYWFVYEEIRNWMIDNTNIKPEYLTYTQLKYYLARRNNILPKQFTSSDPKINDLVKSAKISGSITKRANAN